MASALCNTSSDERYDRNDLSDRCRMKKGKAPSMNVHLQYGGGTPKLSHRCHSFWLSNRIM